MNLRHIAVTSILALAITGVVPAFVHAQEIAPAPLPSAPDTTTTGAVASDAEMAKYQFSALINADNVYVRSGSSENDYPCTKLSKGDPLIVVGAKFDWLKVVPPEGTYCLVSKLFVNKRGDGSIGRVPDDAQNVNVRIGSNLNSMISKVAIQLPGGTDVKILGEQDDYFRIAPPAGVFMYVHKKFVTVVKQVEVVNNNGKIEVKAPADTTTAGTTNGGTTVAGGTTTTTTPETTGTTVTPGSTGTTGTTVASIPSTQPVDPANAAAEADFDKLEASFTASSNQPIEEQPIDTLISGYQKLVEGKKLPESMTRIAEFRLSGLKVRKDALVAYLDSKKQQADITAKQLPIIAETNEIKQRIAANEITRYTAVGTLRASALPYGDKTLYRLTDPVNGRTVIYVLSNDATLGNNEGMFVAINGEVTDDTRRKIVFITPTSVQTINPELLVKGTAAATYLPASLQPSTTTATTGQQ